MQSDLDFALRLADRADAIAMQHFRSAGLLTEVKPDSSPVTQADREVEQELRAEIARERIGDVVLHPRDPGLGDADRSRG